MKIEMTLMPGYVMQVLDEEACQIDSARPEPHSRYKVVDPEGHEDWLCGYDIRVVTP